MDSDTSGSTDLTIIANVKYIRGSDVIMAEILPFLEKMEQLRIQRLSTVMKRHVEYSLKTVEAYRPPLLEFLDGLEAGFSKQSAVIKAMYDKVAKPMVDQVLLAH